MITLQQIAEAAGVSRGTVDRALNNRGRINPEVAEKIRKLADEMGYQPNRAGRALAISKRSISIGMLVQAAATPFMEEVLEGVQAAEIAGGAKIYPYIVGILRCAELLHQPVWNCL